MNKPARIILSVIIAVAIVGCQSPGPQMVAATATPAPPTPTPTATSSPTFTPTPTATPTPVPTLSPTPTATPTSSEKGGIYPGALFELILIEQEVTDVINQRLATQPDSPLRDVYVRFESGSVIAGGKVRLGLFLTLDVEITAVIHVVDGKPIPEIVDVRVGGKPAPGPLRAQLQKMADPYLQRWAEANLAVTVEQVEITRGQVRIVGHYK